MMRVILGGLLTVFVLMAAGCGCSSTISSYDVGSSRDLPVCVPSEAIGPVTPRPAQHADGVFVDLDGEPRCWRTFFSRHKVGAVIIQNIVGYSSAGERFDKTDEAIRLIQEAPPDVQDIYVGLVYDERFNSADVPLKDLEAAAEEDWKLAQAFWRRLSMSQQERVAGWYLGRELHNLRTDDARRKALKRYLRVAADNLPTVDHVLISPYFVPPVPNRPDVLSSAETADLFAFLTEGTKVDVVLLQDGTGARNEPSRKLGCRWDLDAYLPVAAHYSQQLANRLPARLKLWPNIEAFGEDASPRRVARQITLTPATHPVFVFAYRECAKQRACAAR